MKRNKLIDKQNLEQLGITNEQLHELYSLNEKYGKGKTTELINIKSNTVGRLSVKLSLTDYHTNPPSIKVHPVRLFYEFPNHLTLNQRQELENGKLIVIDTSVEGNNLRILYQADSETKELYKTPLNNIQIPNKLNGIKLEAYQKEQLREGKPVILIDQNNQRKEIQINLINEKGFNVRNIGLKQKQSGTTQKTSEDKNQSIHKLNLRR